MTSTIKKVPDLYGSLDKEFNNQYKINLEILKKTLLDSLTEVSEVQPNKTRIDLHPIFNRYFLHPCLIEKALPLDDSNDYRGGESEEIKKFPIGWEIRTSHRNNLYHWIGASSRMRHMRFYVGEEVVSVTYPIFDHEKRHCYRGEEPSFIRVLSEKASKLSPVIKFSELGNKIFEDLENKLEQSNRTIIS
jgi:hypothetical protein